MSSILLYPDKIPACLRRRRQWLPWRWEEKDGRLTKVPIDPQTGNYAKWSNPSILATFNQTLTYVRSGKADGLDFFFQKDDPYVGIDLDSCRSPNGMVRPWAQRIVDEFATYCEVSPSGSGLKLILRGRKPNWAGCKVPSHFVKNYRRTSDDKAVEILLRDSNGCFTLTGRIYRYSEIRIRRTQLTALCRCYWTPVATKSESRTALSALKTELDDVTLFTLISRLQVAERTTDQSGHDFGTICMLLRKGFDPDCCWLILQNYSKFKRGGRRYFDRTVANAKRKLRME